MYGRRDVNGKANAGLTLGIIGTALGAWALFGNRRSAGVLGTGAGLMEMNILISRKLSVLLMKCTMSRTVRNISVKNTICKKPTKFVIDSKIN